MIFLDKPKRFKPINKKHIGKNEKKAGMAESPWNIAIKDKKAQNRVGTNTTRTRRAFFGFFFSSMCFCSNKLFYEFQGASQTSEKIQDQLNGYT